MLQKQAAKKIEAILKNVPHKPGIYKMLDEAATIIYVGKAKDLRKRLQSYFRPKANLPIRKEKMIEKVVDIDYTVVNSELEALVLETNLIKELRPRYNVLMKDDKSYVYIRVSTNEDFPRISVVRKMVKDGAKYFGPKTAGWKVQKTLKLLKKLFPFRHCQLNISWNPEAKNGVDISHKVIKYPCLDYHIKRCIGPCVGVIAPSEYKQLIERVVRFLEGDYADLKADLVVEMQELAKAKKFEQAALLRDKLVVLDSIQEKQDISDVMHENLDVLNLVEEQGTYFINLFQVREGKLISQENFVLKAELLDEEDSISEVLQGFITQYYQEAADIAAKILIPVPIVEREILEEWLTVVKGTKVEFVIPQRGRKNSLLDLALKNAKSYASQMRVKWLSEEKHDPQTSIEDLKTVLALPRLPKRIECYDVSHLGGTETVGSMVVFENGLGKSDHYRHFRIRNLPEAGKDAKPDDFASMEEMLTRRLKYLAALPNDYQLRQPTQKQVVALNLDEKLEIDPALLAVLTKKDRNSPLAILWLKEEDKKAAVINWLSLDKKVELKPYILPFLQYVIRKFDYLKYYLPYSLEKTAPLSFLEIGAQSDRLSKECRYVLEKYRFAFKDVSLNKKPDLIVIDGGKGQLSSARKAFLKFGLQDLQMVALAKKEEEVFKIGQSTSIVLPDNTAAKFLMQRIRDEAHRFAITLNRDRRVKKMTQSQLDDIPGIGEKTKMSLLKKFGSLDQIAAASEDELAEMTNRTVAKLIKASLS